MCLPLCSLKVTPPNAWFYLLPTSECPLHLYYHTSTSLPKAQLCVFISGWKLCPRLPNLLDAAPAKWHQSSFPSLSPPPRLFSISNMGVKSQGSLKLEIWDTFLTPPSPLSPTSSDVIDFAPKYFSHSLLSTPFLLLGPILCLRLSFLPILTSSEFSLLWLYSYFSFWLECVSSFLSLFNQWNLRL